VYIYLIWCNHIGWVKICELISITRRLSLKFNEKHERKLVPANRCFYTIPGRSRGSVFESNNFILLIIKCWLQLQLVFTLPCLELLLKYPLPYNYIMSIAMFLTMFLYTCFYVWREWRRFGPFNYLVLFLTTCIGSFNRSVYLLNMVQSHWVSQNLRINQHYTSDCMWKHFS